MLKIQEWLTQNNFNYDLLKSQLNVSANFHPTDDRVILNYCQIESPKYNDVVRDCRGIILNKNDASLIGRSFRRFFNWGEEVDAMKRFNWDRCYINSKEDGSIITVYKYNGQWRINTRNSYGGGEVNNSGLNWYDIFSRALHKHNKATLQDFDRIADEGMSLVFELCSPFNQIVRAYGEPTLFLLAIFSGEIEWNPVAVDGFATTYGFNRPTTIVCQDPFEVTAAIAKRASSDITFEGFVLRDCHNTRFKLKSEAYLQLHRLANNGNVASWKNLVPIALSGETDEVVTYFPYIQERLAIAEDEIRKIVSELDNIYFCHWDEKSRKKFAEEVKKHPFSSVLFSLYGTPYPDVHMRTELAKYEDKVVDYITRKHK